LREKRGYLRRFAAIGRGAFDGVVGRLGIRYPIAPMRERDQLPATATGQT
jgi:hypothetical protein